MNYDGWLAIGTDLDSKEFDKELKRLTKESDKFAKEEEKLLSKKAKLELDYQKYLSDLKEIEKAYDEAVAHCTTKEQISWETDIANQQIEETNNKYSKTLNELEQINTKIKENSMNQEIVKNKISDTKEKAQGINLNFNKIGESLTSTVRKVTRWAVAVFSVRSAYNAVRNATSTLSQYNDDLRNKIESVKLVFATALEPIITKIVNLVYKLMTYVNYISKAWFEVDLFAKANERSLAKSNKSAKDLRKTLTGFDEMNVLSDNGTTGIDNSSDFSFVMPEDVEIPSWVQWIADNKDMVLDFFKTLGIVIAGIKIATFITKLFEMGSAFSSISKFISPLISGLDKLSGLQIFGLVAGIVITLKGLITLIKGIIDFINDPSWSNFNKILDGLTITLTGVGVAMVALNASNPIGWITIGIGLLVQLGKSLSENETKILDVKGAQEQLTQAQVNAKKAQDDLTSATDNYINAVDRAEEAERKLKEVEEKHKISGEELQKQVDNGTLSYQTMDSVQREVYKAYWDNTKAQDNLKKSIEDKTKANETAIEADKKVREGNLRLELSNEEASGSYDDLKDSIIEAWNNGEIKTEEAQYLISEAMKNMSGDTKQTFLKDLPASIKDGLNTSNYQTTFSSFRNGWNNFWGGLATTLKMDVSATYGMVSGAASKKGCAKGGIVYPKLEYCASGAIINQPGRGIPITQAIGGEKGQEGILPLTDSQQMDLLGSSIARHMNINLTNINQMNGRVISRELKRIEAQQDFATNG